MLDAKDAQHLCKELSRLQCCVATQAHRGPHACMPSSSAQHTNELASVLCLSPLTVLASVASRPATTVCLQHTPHPGISCTDQAAPVSRFCKAKISLDVGSGDRQ